jgi:hypothetical protein
MQLLDGVLSSPNFPPSPRQHPPLVDGNWKRNITQPSISQLLSLLYRSSCPSLVHSREIDGQYSGLGLRGAFTGKTSNQMLVGLGVWSRRLNLCR